MSIILLYFFKYERISIIIFLYFVVIPIIPLSLSLLIANKKTKIETNRYKGLIEKDLGDAKRKVEEEKLKKIEQENIKANNNLTAQINRYNKYQKIIDNAKKQKIKLYEYFSGEYPPDWEYRVNIVKARDNNRCKECGKENKNLHAHHIRPVKDGGLHYLDNLVSLCMSCHLKKHPHLLNFLRNKKRDSHC